MTIFSYTVNFIDVAIAGIFLLFAIIGFNRGLIINVVNFIRYSLGLFLCFYLSQNLYMAVYNYYVKARALDYINQKIVTDTNLDTAISNLKTTVEGMPKFISDMINLDFLSVTSDNLAQSILESVFEPVLLFLIKAAIFISVFLIFFITTRIIINVARRRSKKKEEKRGKKSVLKKTDRVLGLVLGLLKAFVFVLAFTSVVGYILALNEDNENLGRFLTEAKNSLLLQYLNQINPFNAVTEGFI